MVRGNDEHDNHGDGDLEEKEEEEKDEITRSLEKIAWLPSVKLGKQPYAPFALDGMRLSRKEDDDGRGYAPLGGNENSNAASPPPPPGYQHVEILPVLPLPMVRGVDSDCDGSYSSFGDPSSSLGDGPGPIFEGTAGYLPHTKDHVLVLGDDRHKRLYDDLLQLGTDYQRRFMVTVAHPAKEGVFAEYGVLCQLKDLEEISAVAAYEGGEDERALTLDELQRLITSLDGDGDADGLMEILQQTRYQATHDVVGRVRIRRLANPEGYVEGEEYLLAEATILDVVEGDRATAAQERRARAVARIREELGETPTKISESKKKESVALAPKGILVEQLPTSSLGPEERALRESFQELVALQHFLKEECRFTKASVRTFGIGPVGVWLSAAAWVQFVDQRLEHGLAAMQAGLQERLAEHLGRRGDASHLAANDAAEGGVDGEGTMTVDFDELSPSLQREFRLIQGRVVAELGPLALERAATMQRFVQAETYTARLAVLQEFVEGERRRLEAKRVLRSLGSDGDGDENDSNGGRVRGGGDRGFVARRFVSREEARSTFEKSMSAGNEEKGPSEACDEAAFQ